MKNILAFLLKIISKLIFHITNLFISVLEKLNKLNIKQKGLLIGINVFFLIKPKFIFKYIKPVYKILNFIPDPIYFLIIILIILSFFASEFMSLLNYYNYLLLEIIDNKIIYLRTGVKIDNDYTTKYDKEEVKNKKLKIWKENFEIFKKQKLGQKTSYDQKTYSKKYEKENFIEEYERHLNELGITKDDDSYNIKLKYRKLAKKYHPDLSDEDGAREKFQKINEAYEFLTEKNKEKYERLKKG